jgi:PAP2 superfamily
VGQTAPGPGLRSPSLHVGGNLLLALAIAATAKHTWQRVVALAMPVVMTAAVVLTANNYILDPVVGTAVTAAAWVLTGRRHRSLGHGRPREITEARPCWAVTMSSSSREPKHPWTS